MTIASIDIGTNTVLMLIAEYNPATSALKTILNVHNIPRIGKGLTPGSPINKDKIELLYDILREYKKIAMDYKCSHIIGAATNAFRIASNRDELVNYIRNEIGIEISVVTGEDESYLAYLGAISGYPSDDKVLVIDIGGGSTEIILGNGASILYRKSFQAGVVSYTEKYFQFDPPAVTDITSFNTSLQTILDDLNSKSLKAAKAIAIAGTPTTLACIKNNLTDYSEDIIEGSHLNKMEILSVITELSQLSSHQIADKYRSVVKGREDVLLAGSLILFNIMNILKLDEVIVSTKGIRYGAAIKYSMEVKN